MIQQIVFGLIRHLLTGYGGVLVAKGVVDQAGLETVIGAILAILGVVWSATHKIKNESVPANAPQNFLGGNKGNFPGGNSSGLDLLLIALLPLCALTPCREVSAQTVPAPADGAGIVAQNWMQQWLAWIAANGAVGTGYGISADGKIRGVMFSQSVDLPPLSFHLRYTEIIPGIEHATLFQKAGEPDPELIGLNLKVHWFSAPPWVASAQALPVVRTVVWPKLSEWYLQPSIDYPPDRLLRAELAAHHLIFGIKGGWKF